jgi:hypothetical protein
MPVEKKRLNDLSSMGFKDLSKIFIRANAESFGGGGF